MGATRMADVSTGTVLTDEVRAAMEADLSPRKVAAVVGYLAHESCAVTGKTFSAGRDRVALVFVGETQGFRMAGMSPEDVGEHMVEICDTNGWRDFESADQAMAFAME